METYLQQLLTNGGPAGAAVVIVVLLLGLWLRHKGWLFDSPKPAAATNDLQEQLTDMRDRLAQVEREVRSLPTREEIVAIRLSQAQLAERLAGLDRIITSTGAAVGRIEGFMLQASERSAKR